MKQYKVVSAVYNHRTVDGIVHKAWCKEYDFKLSGDWRSDQEFVLNHYASKGWILTQVVSDQSISHVWYFYFEKDI